MSLNLLAGRRVVVTGGSRGVGRAVAELVGHLGASVVALIDERVDTFGRLD